MMVIPCVYRIGSFRSRYSFSHRDCFCVSYWWYGSDVISRIWEGVGVRARGAYNNRPYCQQPEAESGLGARARGMTSAMFSTYRQRQNIVVNFKVLLKDYTYIVPSHTYYTCIHLHTTYIYTYMHVHYTCTLYKLYTFSWARSICLHYLTS